MNTSPQVSVIIPFFNRAQLLVETLHAIATQTFTDFEVIIVDDGSVPEEVNLIQEVLKKWSDENFKYLKRPAEYSKGANSCRSFGLSVSKGRYVKWFDSDDLMKPELLEKQVRQIQKGYDGVLCSCEIWNEDFSKHLKDGWRKLNYADNALKEYLRTQMAWQTGCGLWKRESILSIQPFSEDLTNAQEWIFHLKALTYGLKIGVSNERLVCIRRHESSISANRKTRYFLNRLKARSFALMHLAKTKNPGKRFLLKSIANMIIAQRLFRNKEAYSTLFNLMVKLPAMWLSGSKQSVNLNLLHD
jgi:glycosyltransferase involved in cell wall biosynthesis